MDAKTLAQQVLHVLDLQRSYFDTRSSETLRDCKAAESDLRKACNEIVNPVRQEPTLFDLINNTDSEPTETQRKLMQDESARAMREQEREDAKKKAPSMATQFNRPKGTG